MLGADPSKPTRAWRERVGLVLQECELDPLLTVREAVDLFATFYAAPRPVEETIELTGLGPKRDARIGSLSGGQKRRVDVAVGIVGDPDLIFLDEPTTGFDPTARREAWRMIEGLKELGKTVFLTTHYMDEAQHLADRVAILREGRIVAQGSIGRAERAAEADDDDRMRARRRADLDRERAPAGGTARPIARADERGIEVAELEVRRPNLEDVFLEATR